MADLLMKTSKANPINGQIAPHLRIMRVYRLIISK